jgi:ubiquinone/menaquinone biosynthesis C-methylase UbiE
MDALHMSAIPDGCFDLIIDKGLLDAQLCSDNNIDDVTALVKEMYRVLTPGE